jgi:hypothetical protein
MNKAEWNLKMFSSLAGGTCVAVASSSPGRAPGDFSDFVMSLSRRSGLVREVGCAHVSSERSDPRRNTLRGHGQGNFDPFPFPFDTPPFLPFLPRFPFQNIQTHKMKGVAALSIIASAAACSLTPGEYEYNVTAPDGLNRRYGASPPPNFPTWKTPNPQHSRTPRPFTPMCPPPRPTSDALKSTPLAFTPYAFTPDDTIVCPFLRPPPPNFLTPTSHTHARTPYFAAQACMCQKASWKTSPFI